MSRLTSLIKRELLTGLVLLAPVGGAAWLVYWLVTSVDGLFPAAWRPRIHGTPLPGLGLISVLVLALIAGLVAHNFLGARLVKLFDDVVHRIPLFGSTYGLIKQVLESVFSSGGGSFKQAVLVEYPVAGSYAIAFVAQNNVTGKLRDAASDDIIAVYVPTTPNPTSGFYLLVEKSKARPLDMTVEQAFKLVLTMGIADSPESLATTAKWTRSEIIGKKAKGSS
jgi:uncharacterized membrane protein